VFSLALFFLACSLERIMGKGEGVRSWEQNLTVGFGFNASNFVKKMGWSFCYNWCFA